MTPGFAVWITGRPAAGKSTIAALLATALRARHIDVEVIESDVLRRVLTPRPSYSEAEREMFYAAIATIGELLAKHGVAVILDATAHRRVWRARARERIPRFAEVYVDCPEAVCVARDPKGIYRKAREGLATTVPGLQVPYEAPERADVVVSGDREHPDAAAARIVQYLIEQRWVSQ